MSVESSDHDKYRIVIYSELNDPRALSRIFEQELNRAPRDASVWIHHIPGVLNEDFARDKAENLASAMRSIGLRVSVILRADIPNLHQAIVVLHPCCTDEGLQLIEPAGHSSAVIPWSAMQMVCVGEVAPNVLRRHPPTIPVIPPTGHHYQRPAIDVPFTPLHEAWITCQPPFPHLRFDQDRMNFEDLGSRQVDSAATNFRQFIQDVIAHAPAVFVPECTRAFLDHDQERQHQFKNSEALLHYATLQTLLAREKLIQLSPTA